VDEAPAIPLYTLSRADLVSKRVGNYIYNPEFGVLLDQLWVK
jgi:ABC-type transport system substrate-binding protein